MGMSCVKFLQLILFEMKGWYIVEVFYLAGVD